MSAAGWSVEEHDIDRGALGRSESLFALANGHLGLRGNLDEGEPRAISGTYLNGFYESYPLEYGERGFGFAEDGQTVVNVADGKVFRLLVENEPVDVERGVVEHHTRGLDLRTGVLAREMCWRSAYGDRVRVRSRRLVSFVQRSVAAIRYEIEALDRPLRIALQSALIANQSERAGQQDPRSARDLGRVLEPDLVARRQFGAVLGHVTRRTRLGVAAGMDHLICPPEGAEPRIAQDLEEDLARLTVSIRLEPGQSLRLDKLLAYHWSSRQTVQWLRDQVDGSLENALAEGFDGLAAAQRSFLDKWWERADLQLTGDDEIQLALRFALFHLLQAGARVEGRAIAAKGLTGTGYDGHAFWDTEAFVLPVLSYLEPRAVRDALEWRHATLPLARERAKLLSLDGALLPWRTIHGEECSGYWPAGLAAVHVNADVADAVRRYVFATGDEDFECEHGLELYVDTARLWNCLGRYDREGRYRIAGVTGPDEYSALGDDNVFTNLMAQMNLRCAASAAERHGERAAELGVEPQEIAEWRRAADAMHVPYDERLGVHPQHEGFLELGEWDFEATPEHIYPLLLHIPYFALYRQQVVKQADLVLALWLRGDAFSDADRRRDFEYYERITVRDSSLSAAAQAVVAAEVGHVELAWTYLREAALTDLRDLHGNAVSGLHMASLGGAVLAAIAGLGGFRDQAGELRFRPRLPAALSRLCFRLLVRGSLLEVELRDGQAGYRVVDGEPLEVFHWEERLQAGPEPVSRPLPPMPELDPPGWPAGREPGAP